jgi:hypothetical protein
MIQKLLTMISRKARLYKSIEGLDPSKRLFYSDIDEFSQYETL